MIPELYQPYFVILIITLIFVSIYREIMRPSISFLAAVLIFVITGILTSQEVLEGFSNDKIASIILLILITTGLRKNFQIEKVFALIFKGAKSYRSFLIRMMGQVAVLSSMINNTPVVALMTPYVFNWGKKHNIAPSRLLIPLSFATIMGGMLTIIGTSTTLLLNGFLGNNGEPLIRSVDLLQIGLAVTITGILFIYLVGHRLLPSHTDIIDKFRQNQREYLVETRLSRKSDMIGKSVIEAGLRNLEGVYLVEIIRKSTGSILPVEPEEMIEEEDKLIFAGNTENIVELVDGNLGLELPKHAENISSGSTEVVECVISQNSSIIGRSVKESNFRSRYNAVVIAIHRGAKKITGRIGDIVLEPGDLLLLYTGPEFNERVEIYRDLYIISTIQEKNPPSRKKYVALFSMVICIILLFLYGQFSLFPSLLIIFSILVGFGMITLQDIKRELDLNLLAILVFSLSLGLAILKTDAGSLMANGVISLLEPYGNISILIGLMFITNILTSLIGNVGAVSICFPLAYSLSVKLGIDGAPYYLGIAYAASAAFMTPISYQTNLIIYGPGGYTFKDFFKIGLPVNILYLGVALLCIIALYKGVLL
jgi:di/tricarboxylate transporter